MYSFDAVGSDDDYEVRKTFQVFVTDKPEMPKLANFAHYKIYEDSFTGSDVGDITKALSEADPSTLQFGLAGGHMLPDVSGGTEAFDMDACEGMVGFKMPAPNGVDFSVQNLYFIEVAVSLRKASPPVIYCDGQPPDVWDIYPATRGQCSGVTKLVNAMAKTMFINVEILDGNTVPKFGDGNGLTTNPYPMIGSIKESSVCGAAGGRRIGCACHLHSECMTTCSCNTCNTYNSERTKCINGCNGNCLKPTIPIGAYDPDGPHNFVLEVTDTRSHFEPASYNSYGTIGAPDLTQNSLEQRFIHPTELRGHIDGQEAVTEAGTNTYTINFPELTMIVGIVIMAAPAQPAAPRFNYVADDEDVVWGPTPDFEACQIQCDICNTDEVDIGDPDKVICRCQARCDINMDKSKIKIERL